MSTENATNKTINESMKNLNKDNKKMIKRIINETNNYSKKQRMKQEQ